MKDFLKEHIEEILMAIIILLTIIIIVIIVFDIKLPKKEEEVKENNNVALVSKKETEEPESEETVTITEELKYYVDIKGAVKKPGVYEVEKGMIINDVIKLAGGLKSNASTKYLNLSKHVTNEMVINIFTTTEIKELDVKEETVCSSSTADIKDCASSTIVESNELPTTSSPSDSSSETPKTETPTNTKININTASLNELMNISGIGESKAQAIIEYRNTNGLFKSIEDIKNVSGIGDALYEKIKNSITI